MDMAKGGGVVAAAVVLTKGYSEKGSFKKKVEVRALNGYDQQSLANLPDSTPQPLKTTELLCRVARFETKNSNSIKHGIDSKESMNKSKEIIGSLTIGDRIALLLYTRKVTFGDVLHLELRCPHCNKVVSSDLSIITSLLVRHDEGSSNSNMMDIKHRGYNLRIRPITGKDQEKLLQHHHIYQKNQDKKGSGHSNGNDGLKEEEEEELCSEFLIRNCIISCSPKLTKKKLPSSFVRHISSKLEELDPQSNLIFKMQCPYCNNFIEDFFDVEDFIFRELDLHGRGLYQEVNYLALFYHWTEDAILSLPIMKRKKYVDLIDRTLLLDRGEIHE
jgi:hypothetical protein